MNNRQKLLLEAFYENVCYRFLPVSVWESQLNVSPAEKSDTLNLVATAIKALMLRIDDLTGENSFPEEPYFVSPRSRGPSFYTIWQ